MYSSCGFLAEANVFFLLLSSLFLSQIVCHSARFRAQDTVYTRYVCITERRKRQQVWPMHTLHRIEYKYIKQTLGFVLTADVTRMHAIFTQAKQSCICSLLYIIMFYFNSLECLRQERKKKPPGVSAASRLLASLTARARTT